MSEEHDVRAVSCH